MTYEASEVSKHSGRPIELFRYVGTYETFRYTSSQAPIDFQAPDEVASHTYTPLAMQRSALNNATQNDDNAEVSIDMPVSTDIIAIYGFQISPPALECTIFRGHNPGEFIRAWSGQVENISVVKGTASIRVPSDLASALSADFPNVYFQGPCNHTLFDARCGIDVADWSATQEITVIDGKTITVDDVPDELDGLLIGGDALLPSGERRMIISQIGSIITINYPFAGAEVGDDLIIAAGCDLAHLGDCKTKFDNTQRFGGFPYIPSKNIFNSGLEPGKNVFDNSETCFPLPNPWTLKIAYMWTAPNNLTSYIPLYDFNLPQFATGMPNGKTLNKGHNISIGSMAGGAGATTIPGTAIVLENAIRDNNYPDASPGGPMVGFRRIYQSPGLLLGFEYYFFFPIDPDAVDRNVNWNLQFGAGSFMGVPEASRGGVVSVHDALDNVIVSFSRNPEQLFPFNVNFTY